MWNFVVFWLFSSRPEVCSARNAPFVFPDDVVYARDENGILSRARRTYDREVLEHINRLHITDPSFYDVFTEEEIFSLFPVPPSSEIPVHMWGTADNHTRLPREECQPENKAHFRTTATAFYNALANKSVSTEEALIQLVPIPDDHICSEKYLAVQSTAFHEIFDSKPFKQFGGSNFVHVRSGFPEAIAGLRAANWYFANPKAFLQARTVNERVLTEIPVSFNAMNFQFVPCTAFSPYTAHDEAFLKKAAERWGRDRLESYKNPQGIYAEVLGFRRRWLWFEGQADLRPAYNSRVKLLRSFRGTLNSSASSKTNLPPDDFAPSYLISVSSRQPKELPECDENHTGPCRGIATIRGQIDFAARALNSVFGFHFRGDDHSSARIQELLLFQMIPIIVMKPAVQISLPYPCIIPWKEFAIIINEEEFDEDPVNALRRALGRLSHNDLEKKFRLLEYYRREALFLKGGRVVQNTLRSILRACLPISGLSRRAGLNPYDLRSCPFEDSLLLSTLFPRESDADSTPPWAEPHE